MDEAVVPCEECRHEVDELAAVAEQWRFFSNASELLSYCRECSEFGGEATGPVGVEAGRGDRAMSPAPPTRSLNAS